MSIIFTLAKFNTLDPSIQTETSTLSTSAGQIAAKMSTTYKTYPWATLRTAQIEDPDGSALTTTWSYDEDAQSASRGRVLVETNPDGTSLHHSYDPVTGLRIQSLRKAPDQSVLSTSEYRYVNTDINGDGTSDSFWIENHSSQSGGITRSYRLESGALINLNGQDYREIQIQRPLAAEIDSLSGDYSSWSYAWDAPGNESIQRREYAGGPFAGESAWELNADGTLETWDRSLNSNTGAVTVIYERGEPNATQSSVIAGMRTTTETTSTGLERLRQVEDIASALLIERADVTESDAAGRPLRTVFLDGTFETRSYACCGLQSTTGIDGLVTSYLYDELGRVEYITTAEGTPAQQVSQTVYDAAGNTLEIWTGPALGSLAEETENVYDLAGRLTQQRERYLDTAPSAAYQTTMSYVYLPGGGERTTTTYPNGSTRTDESLPEGGRYEITGSAARGMRYSYAIETHATIGYPTQTETVTLLDASAAPTAEYSKTYRDALGRTLRVERPDSTGAIAANTYSYNTLGQLTSRSDPDGQTTLYAYDAEGALETTALDVNGDGQINTDGTDRITRQQTLYTTRSENGQTYTVQRRTTEILETEGSATATEISRYESTLGVQPVLSWSTQYAVTTRSSATLDATARTLTRETLNPDGSRVVSLITDGRETRQSVYDGADNLLSQVSYGYDSEGRITSLDDYYNGPTSYTYYSDDQLKSRTTPDPDPTQSGPGYDAQTTVYSYSNSPAEISRTTTLPDSSTVLETYWPTGELKSRSGSQTYPVSYSYDYAGRLLTQSTWQDPATGSATQTIWKYDPAGQLRQKWYDAAIDPAGTITGTAGPQYSYTPGGRLATRTHARGTQTSYSYTPHSFDLSTISHDDGQTTSVSYDAYDRQGRPLSITDSSGTRTQSYTSGRLLDETYTAGALAGYQIDRSLDSLNRPAQIQLLRESIPVYNSTYGYDSASRLQSVSHAAHSFTYQYDPGSELRQSLSFNNGATDILEVQRRVDPLGRLISLSTLNQPENQTRSYSYLYNALNQRTRMTDAGGAYWQYSYDNLGQIDSATRHDTSGAVLPGYQYGYSFDAIGNREQTTSNGRTADYSVNPLNQYTSREVPRALDVRGSAHSAASVTVNGQSPTRQGNYFYQELDQSGQGSSAQQVDIQVSASLTGAGDNGLSAIANAEKSQYLPADPESYQYDADGNLTADGQWSYSWNGENRLITMETLATAYNAGAPRQKLEFAYDSQGRRYRKTVSDWDSDSSSYEESSHSLYLYDGWNLLSELKTLPTASPSSSSATAGFTHQTAYVWGLDLSGSMQGAGGVGGLLAVTDPSGSTAYPAYDGNGNVMGYYAAATGEHLAEFEYGPFGEPLRESFGAHSETPVMIEAEAFDAGSGVNEGSIVIGSMDSGDYVRYDSVDFGEGLGAIRFYFSNGLSSIGGRYLSIRLDSTGGTEIGRFYPEVTGSWSSYTEKNAELFTEVSGVHDLYLVGQGGGGICNLNFFRLYPEPSTPAVSEEALAYRFSTKYQDSETGLLYYGFRYYDPETGRWLSRDPIGEIGGLNLYGMVGNNPVNSWDYLGLRNKPAVKLSGKVQKSFQDASELLDLIAEAMSECAKDAAAVASLGQARTQVSGSIGLNEILEELRKDAGDISKFSKYLGNSVEGFANVNEIAAYVYGTDSGNQEYILSQAEEINSSLKNIQTLISLSDSAVGIANDQNTLNVLGEVLSVGSTLSKNVPIAQALNYYGSAAKGIHKGLGRFAIEDSKKNLKQIRLSCALCGSAEERDLKRLNLSLKIKN